MNEERNNEVWKDVEGFEGRYQISDNGNVKSLVGKSPRIMRQCWAGKGFRKVTLSKAPLDENGKPPEKRAVTLIVNTMMKKYFPFADYNPEEFLPPTSDTLAKTFRMINPEGNIITFFNLNEFCRRNNIPSSGLMCKVVQGEREEYRGYRQAPPL